MQLRRLIPCSTLLAGLMALGGGLYWFLPAEAIWTLDDCCHIDTSLGDQGLLLTWHGDRDSWPAHPPLVLRDIRTGEPIRTVFDEKGHKYTYLSDGCQWVAGLCHDGKTMHIVPLEGGPERIVTFGDGETPQWCGMPPDGSVLAVQLHRWDNGDQWRFAIFGTIRGKELALLPGRHSSHFTSDGKFLIVLLMVAEEGESRLKVWDVQKGNWAIDYGPIAGTNGKISASPDGRTLLGTFPLEQREYETAVWDLRTLERSPLPIKTKYHWQHAVSAGGRTAIVSRKAHWKSHIAVWDPDTRSWIFQVESEEMSGHVSLSGDGKRLLFQSSSDVHAKSLVLFDVDTGRRLWGITEPVLSLAGEPEPMFGADDRTVVVYRGQRGSLHADFIDCDTGKVVASLPIAREGWSAGGTVTVTALSNRAHVVDVFQPSPLVGPWFEWLPAFLRPADQGMHQLVVADLETRTVRARMARPEQEYLFVGAGRQVITVPGRNGGALTKGPVCCYDLPGHGPWRYVLGIPAALGGTFLGFAALRKRGRRKAAPNPA